MATGQRVRHFGSFRKAVTRRGSRPIVSNVVNAQRNRRHGQRQEDTQCCAWTPSFGTSTPGRFPLRPAGSSSWVSTASGRSRRRTIPSCHLRWRRTQRKSWKLARTSPSPSPARPSRWPRPPGTCSHPAAAVFIWGSAPRCAPMWSAAFPCPSTVRRRGSRTISAACGRSGIPSRTIRGLPTRASSTSSG